MSFERGSLLYQTGRFEQAEQEFRAALGTDPNNALIHGMLAFCLLHRKLYQPATEEAQLAIELRPDWDFGYTALAGVMYERGRFKQAVEAISQAIALDPFDPEHHATLAEIRLRQENWPAALASADAGLAIDAEHARCVNARGVALVKLNRRTDAAITMQGALQRNPHSAITHANQGWALLNSGDHRQALEHFREALRINPEMQYAKAGIVEALKSRNILYRLMLRYFLFMARISSGSRWGIIIGLYAVYQLVLMARDKYPAIAPAADVFVIIYVIFALATWLAAPLFNLLLRLDRFGKYALSRDQKTASNVMGFFLLCGLALAVTALIEHDRRYLISGALLAVMSMSTSAIFNCDKGWPRWAMTGYSAVLLGLAGLVITFLFSATLQDIDWFSKHISDVVQVFAWGVLLSSFAANALMQMKVKR